MEQETPLAKNIDAAGEKARYDQVCKRLLSYKNVLAWILKECVREYKDCDINDIAEKYIEGMPQISTLAVHPDEGAITGANTEDSTISEGTVTYDIRFDALAPAGDGVIKLILNLEAQNQFHSGYSLVTRGLYYCARMLSAQYGKEFVHSDYQNIKKVYSIFICMKPPQDREHTITHYRITEDNQIGEVKEDESNYDLLNMTMICLGRPGQRIYGHVLRLLDVLLSSEMPADEKKDILQNEFSIKMIKQMEGDVLEMCNLSQGVEQRGIEKGLAQGLAKGRQEGLARGRQEGIRQAARELAAAGFSAEKIAEALHIPELEFRPLLRRSKNEIFAMQKICQHPIGWGGQGSPFYRIHLVSDLTNSRRYATILAKDIELL